MVSVEKCRSIAKKHGYNLDNQTLVELRNFLETWARLQIEEENNNVLIMNKDEDKD